MLAKIRGEGIKPLPQVKLIYMLLMLALIIEMVALGIGAVLGLINGDYLANTKAARDAAAGGSSILTQLGQVKAVGTWLLPFQFLGFAVFFAAIGLALSSIMPRIQLRGEVMAEGLRELLVSNNQSREG